MCFLRHPDPAGSCLKTVSSSGGFSHSCKDAWPAKEVLVGQNVPSENALEL